MPRCPPAPKLCVHSSACGSTRMVFASIAVGIDGPRLFRHEGLPIGPPWPDVQRLIASTGGDFARDTSRPRHLNAVGNLRFPKW